MYDYQNIGYHAPASPMTPMYNGGYPGGYPPFAPPNPQSMMMTGYGNTMVPPVPPQVGYGMPPVVNTQVQVPPISGVDGPIEFQFSDGTTIVANQAGPSQGVDPAEIEKIRRDMGLPASAPSHSQQMSMGYTQGGARVSQGGYNPVDGVTTPAVANQGFNPYSNAGPTAPPVINGATMQGILNQVQNGPSPVFTGQGRQLIGNPGYMTPNPSNFGMGFAPYSPPGVDPYAFKQPWEQQQQVPMGAQMGLGMFPFDRGQNQFNYTLQDLLYEEQPSAVDARALLADVVLSDMEKERANSMKNEILGYDYYSRPIYSASGYYRQATESQRMFEEARHNHQAHFTMLSRIAHAYSGEKIDEEATMKRFDPVPPPPPQPKYFNPATATPEERYEFQREQFAQQGIMLDAIATKYESDVVAIDAYRQQLRAQIKASHDKLLGIEPGQHYDLKTYMDNGYKLGVDIAMRKAKSANRNGTTKYSRYGFRNDMNANPRSANQSQVPVTSSDDEYVSVEAMLKSIYTQNKTRMVRDQVRQLDESQLTLVRNKDGTVNYVSDPDPGVLASDNIDAILSPNASEREAHMFFLENLQKKKEIDDVRRGLN